MSVTNYILLLIVKDVRIDECVQEDRIPCRNGQLCIYYKSRFCNFLHNIEINYTTNLGAINEKINAIYKNIQELGVLDAQATSGIQYINELLDQYNMMNEKLGVFENLLKTVTMKLKDINDYSDKLKHINSESFVVNEIECMKCSINFTNISEYDNHKHT